MLRGDPQAALGYTRESIDWSSARETLTASRPPRASTILEAARTTDLDDLVDEVLNG